MYRSLSTGARYVRGTMAAAFRRHQSGRAGHYGGASYGAYGGVGADIEGPLPRSQPTLEPNQTVRKETRPVPSRERPEKKKREEFAKTVEEQRRRDKEIGRDWSGRIFPGGES